MKILVSFVLVILISLSVSVAAFIGMSSIQHTADDMYAHNVIAMQAMGNIREAFQQERVYFRDMLIYIDDSVKVNAAIENVNKAHVNGDNAVNAYLAVVGDMTNEVEFLEASKLLDPSGGAYFMAKDKIMASAKAGDAAGVLEGIEDAATYIAVIERGFSAAESNQVKAAADRNEANQGLFIRLIIIQASILTFVIVFIILMGLYLSGSISKPLSRLLTLVAEVAKGNLNINTDRSLVTKDEAGMLTQDVYNLIGIIKNLIGDLSRLTNEFMVNGDIEYRIDEEKYDGSYREMVEKVNAFVNDQVSDTLMILGFVENIGNGDFEAELKQLPGKKIVLNQRLNALTATLNDIYADLTKLTESASEGRLNEKIAPDKYEGGWFKITEKLDNLTESIKSPIIELKTVMTQVALGNFSYKIQGDYKGDFLVIKDSVNNTVSNIALYIDEISSILTALADNDLNQKITHEYIGEFFDIEKALNNIIDKFNQVITEIYSATEQVSAGTKQIADSSMTLAQGATEQAQSVDELNVSISDINKSTTQNAESAQEAVRYSDSSKSHAARGSDYMDKMLESMEGIKESSNNISNIIKVINEISFQTNMLALNAAVEAARAGIHGKGFAVVAEEVRNLAGKSQIAAKDTAALIEKSINRVNDGTEIAGQTAEALRAIVGDVTQVANLISNIAEASADQKDAIGQVLEGVNKIYQVVQDDSAVSEETASASQELASQAEVLKGLVNVFILRTNAS
jgi:methyl-accepting chemotaxis protein